MRTITAPALAAAVVVLRAWDLGGPALWLDEAYSANYAGLPFSELVPRLAREATPPLYYLLLRVWTQAFGAGELAVRAFSALCSVGAVGVLALFVRELAGSRAAAIACTIAAAAPLHVYYAQEARMYALLGLLAIALLGLAARALERPTAGGLAAAAFVSWAALLTHNVALWWVAGVNAGVLLLAPSNTVRLRWLVAQGVAALAYLPWLWVLLQQLAAQGEVLAWFEPYWRARSALGHLASSGAGFALGPFPPWLAIASPLPGARWLSLLCAAIAAAGAWHLRGSRPLRLLLVALAGALALSLGYSVAVQPVHIAGRTDQALLLPWLALLALGLHGLRPRWAGPAGAALFAGCALETVAPHYASIAKEASRGWISALASEARPGDLLICTGLTRAEADYYLGSRRGPGPEIESYPARLAEHPGYVNHDALRAEPAMLDRDARHLAGRARTVAARGGRTFVLLTPPGDVNGVLMEALEARLRAAPRTVGDFRRTGGGPVRLLRFGAR